MYYYIYANKDATIYSDDYKDSYKKNTGLDEIIELEKKTPIGTPSYDSIENSRILLKFDITEVSKSMNSNMIPTITEGTSVSLKLFTARPTEIPISYTLNAYPLSGSWAMGKGKKYHSPITKDGVSWHYKDYDGGTMWVSSSYGNKSTSSYGSMKHGGGNWITSSVSSQAFEYESADVNMDVGNIFKEWFNQAYVNEGFIVKRSDSDEQSSAALGTLPFFSRDTHTIYPPRLEFKWDDSKWETTASMNVIDISTKDPVVYMKGRGRTFKELSKVKFRVYTRDRYRTNSPTVGKYEMFKHHYLPSGSSYYSIKDTVTEETIIPFSNESKLSADKTSNYFNIWMNGLQPERYYRVLIKAVSGSGNPDEVVNFYDDNFTFKVER